MKIGVDTTALIDFNLKDIPRNIFEEKDFAICDFVFFESMIGYRKKDDIIELVNELTQYTSNFAIAKRAAAIFKDLKKKGKEINQADCLIAATYLENGVTKILTKNKKHFSQIPGIEVVVY